MRPAVSALGLLLAAIEQTLRDHYLKQGVTSVYDMAGNQAILQYWALHDEGKLAVRLRITSLPTSWSFQMIR